MSHTGAAVITAASILESMKDSDEKTSTGLAMQAVDAAIKGCQNAVQVNDSLIPIIAEAAYRGLLVAQKHGNVMPLDRLVKGIPDHPSVRRFRFLVIAWVRKNSPVYWDKDANPHQAKEGEPNYKPYNVERAASEPFNSTPEAKRAQGIADAAFKRALQPVTRDNFLSRVSGIRLWFENAQKPNDNNEIRGVKESDRPFILEGLKLLDNAMAGLKATHPVSGVKAADSQGRNREAVVAAKDATRRDAGDESLHSTALREEPVETEAAVA